MNGTPGSPYFDPHEPPLTDERLAEIEGLLRDPNAARGPYLLEAAQELYQEVRRQRQPPEPPPYEPPCVDPPRFRVGRR